MLQSKDPADKSLHAADTADRLRPNRGQTSSLSNSRSVDCQRGPQRVASEKPRESRALALAGGAKSRDQSSAQQRVRSHAFVDAHLGPLKSLVQTLVGCRDIGCFIEQTLIVGHVLFVKRL